MRGKVAEMQRVYEIAQEHDITVIEDCAHALGVMWDGVQLGRSASVACYSSQSAKVINSGEGGFFMTDDDELAAKAACYAGCYEQLYLQHVVAPPAEVFDRVKFGTPILVLEAAMCSLGPSLGTWVDISSVCACAC